MSAGDSKQLILIKIIIALLTYTCINFYFFILQSIYSDIVNIFSKITIYPASTQHWNNLDSTLIEHSWHWINIESTLF